MSARQRQSDDQINEILRKVWLQHPKFEGFEAISVQITGRCTTVTCRCKIGHVFTSPFSSLKGRSKRGPTGCGECYFRTEEKTKNDVQRMWDNGGPKFRGIQTLSVFYITRVNLSRYGYRFIRAKRQAALYWTYTYQCRQGHTRTAAFISNTVFGCSECDSPRSLGDLEVAQRIKKTWVENEKIFKGYEVIKVGKWLERTTIVKCPVSQKN